jgi:hypothetical protein
MSTQSRNVYVRNAHLWSCERVVVLDSRHVDGDTVNELIENRTLLLKSTPGWPGPFTSVVARTRRLPTAE